MEIEDEGAINLSTASSVPPTSIKADVLSPSVMVNGDIRHSASENGDSHPQVHVPSDIFSFHTRAYFYSLFQGRGLLILTYLIN